MPHGSFGLALNNCNVVTQKPTNPLCTLKQFDLVVEVNGVTLERRLCDELNAGDCADAGSVVLTVLRPTVSVNQLLRAAAKLARRKGTSSANSSPNGSRSGLSLCRKTMRRQVSGQLARSGASLSARLCLRLLQEAASPGQSAC